jgi:hypothetical protein
MAIIGGIPHFQTYPITSERCLVSSPSGPTLVSVRNKKPWGFSIRFEGDFPGPLVTCKTTISTCVYHAAKITNHIYVYIVDVDRLYMCISAVHVSIVPRFDLDLSGATSPCNSSSAPHWSHGRYAGGLNKLNEAERSGAEFPGVDEGVSHGQPLFDLTKPRPL